MTSTVPEPAPTLLGEHLPAITVLLTPGTDQSWQVTYRDSNGTPQAGTLRMRLGRTVITGQLVDGVASLELPASSSSAELLGEEVLLTYVGGDGKVRGVARGTVQAQ